ncbi:Oidioi.mRNA.OKI2018_I69.PAR.g9772.t1.cds [Oikopleura dioica]|uniref:Oidioi.mRNA.OKI2018_I69.PAR.g9772.t1.cds n=1 Tax=Oikopleura dioica TaxID=34765 RepID=A0ABN7RM53_OIKDI|nr:Oidioi.mRNA.OKI2018_I69.PAR.g9772.t1.cds [Oikopleura dioica]
MLIFSLITVTYSSSFCYIQHKQDWIILQESCFESWNGINVTEEKKALIGMKDGFIIGQVKEGPYPKDTESPCDFHSENEASGSPGEYVIFCEENSKKQNCDELKTELESCNARKFVCKEVDNSEQSEFNCPRWTEWNQWSDCIAQHPCSPNRTRYERKQLRECTHNDDCMIDCIGSNEKTEDCLYDACPDWSEWASWSDCIQIPSSFADTDLSENCPPKFRLREKRRCPESEQFCSLIEEEPCACHLESEREGERLEMNGNQGGVPREKKKIEGLSSASMVALSCVVVLTLVVMVLIVVLIKYRRNQEDS